MANQEFKVFYREHGTMTVDGLADPDPIIIKKLPTSSMIHYLGDPDSPGLDPSDPLMKGYTQKVVFYNAIDYDPGVVFGSARKPDIQQDMVGFMKNNRNFARVKEIKEFKPLSNTQLGVVDYSWIDKFHHSADTVLKTFDRVEALIQTIPYMVSTINAINRRNHFIVLPVPANLVAKSVLDTKALSDQPQLSNSFYGLDEQLLRHMWLFINPKLRGNSAFGLLSATDLRTINFLFKMYDGKYAVLNLGYLHSWVKGNTNETFNSQVNAKTFVDVQKYYLRGMMSLQAFDANGATLLAQEEAAAEQKAKLDAVDTAEEEGSELDQRFLEDAEQEADSVRDENQQGTSFSINRNTSGKALKRGKEDIQPEINSVSSAAGIDRDIQALEEVQARRQVIGITAGQKAVEKEHPEVVAYTGDIPDDVESIRASLFTTKTPEQLLLSKLDALVVGGRINPAEFRRKKELITNSVNMPDPYGSGKTVTQASTVTKEELGIDKAKATMNVPKTVLDKSMAESSLNVMGPAYNNSVIYKDVLACIQYAQRGGVVVKSHTVDRKTSIHGDYDIHSIELAALQGQTSVVKVRVPVVHEEGYFSAKGSRYCMRQQRVD